ncbi:MULTISPECIES: transposase [unclassified Pseudomonas]|uniref:REP-associated tyrosine transposase n=1 Tax=unclassified Pseudomonas TaxID=196821 RepID=UPI0012971C0B|nr:MULTISPECIES: transposase [unclassified Pseudomonas]MDU7557390.1 transposase [Pseudomonas sp.]MQT44525.1 transposase [Pseudomonas sp. FSL R10-0765]MQT53976.1 transposase [Pseudomonas sp. FSL R10-2398]MQT99212.1 transposase [Pseudomonas sp. FSL R10-2245]MQU12902.1 transposase [Pseudomonas sp. FSL R10-2189]
MSGAAQACRLRKGRYGELGRIYALTAVVKNRKPIFNDFGLSRLLINELRRSHAEGLVNSLAWVVMPDHFHWLIELQQSPLSIVMQRTKSRSARAINAACGRFAQCWQAGYHDRAIRFTNPLRAGLVKRLGDYPHWDAIWL